MSQLYIGVWNHKDQFGNFSPNCQLKCNTAMKLNIDENIVERCGSEEACGAWY